MFTVPVKSEERGVRQALFDALCELRDTPALNEYRAPDGKPHIVNFSLVDAGWLEDVVWAFMIDSHQKGIKGWMPVLGRGQSAPPGSGAYSHPTPDKLTEKSRLQWIGEQCYISKSKHVGLSFCTENSDVWKSFVHDGYKTPPGSPGSLSCFDPSTKEDEALLVTYRRHLLAEKREWREVPKRGKVAVWIDSGADDHYFDADAYSCVAANILGVSVVTRVRPNVRHVAPRPVQSITMPDGRPYMEMGESL